MSARPSISRMAVWLAGLAGLSWALLRLGVDAAPLPPASLRGLTAWLRQTDPVVVTFSIVRGAALVGACYLLATVALTLAARLVGSARLLAAVDLFTVAPVRRLLQGALAIGLGSGLAAAEGSSALAATVAAEAEPGTATMRRLDGPPPATPTPLTGGHSWSVEPGDHLWSIAERTLAQAWSRPPSDAEVGPYWVTLVERNRPRLADPANPDLLFAGQVMELPELPRPP